MFRWNSLKDNVCHFDQERLLDVKLAGEGGIVRAHRVVLAAASAYFEDLLADCTDHLPTIFFRSDKIRQHSENNSWFSHVPLQGCCCA